MRLRQVVSGLAVACWLSALGCHAQVPAAGTPLSADTARRIEILIRQRSKITPDDTIAISAREPSDIPGYDKIEVVFMVGGKKSKSNVFFLSKDGKTLGQFGEYDIGKDPKTIISAEGRPSRGGPATAPVEVVMFDDLECPFCARMHKQLFPALTDRYGDQVRIVYRDYPISQHPWAMRAAVDVNCVAAQSTPGYWNLVDFVHSHASEFGGADRSLPKANDSLDQAAVDEAKKQGLKPEAVSSVEACVKKQDQTDIKASIKLGDSLDLGATPVMYINGEQLEGAYPLEDVFRMVDQALAAAGKPAPPPYLPTAGVAKDGN